MAAADRTPAATIAALRPDGNSPATEALLGELKEKYGPALEAVLLYGSCLRSGNHFDGLLDLYLIVDDYRNTRQNPLLAFANRILPPNVFYLEGRAENRIVRAKYAILTLSDFKRGCQNWFHPYLWGRFAQPTALLFANSPATAAAIDRCQAAAAVRFIDAVVPCLPASFTLKTLWSTGLDLSYASELRPERPGQGERLYEAGKEYYDRLADTILPRSRFRPQPAAEGKDLYTARVPEPHRRRARQAWRLRSRQGKMLSLLRLTKAAFTFQGGFDYLAWKVERHSGLKLTAPAGRRHTFITFSRALWKAWRKKGFR